MAARILVVDDEPDIRFLLKDILEDEGYEVDVAEHARAAIEIRQKSQPDLVLLDIWMPEIDGVTLLKQWKSDESDHCPVVMMSGHGTVETAVEATRYGAYDFVEKPLSMAKLLSTVKSALSSNESISHSISTSIEAPVGSSELVQVIRKRMQSLARSSAPVFLVGPAGSGRKIWADYLSGLSHSQQALQVYDPTQELTQYLPLTADLYVQEIILLDRNQQSALHRLVSNHQQTDVFRLIASSSYSFTQLLEENYVIPELAEFWRDAVEIPSLEEHIEDIPELLKYYVDWFSEQEQLPYRHFGVAMQNLLRNHQWEGNLTQLKQFIQTILRQGGEEAVQLDEVNQALQTQPVKLDSNSANTLQILISLDMDLREAREVFEREYLARHLELSGHNITELARRVGQERTHLYRKLKSLGLYNKKPS